MAINTREFDHHVPNDLPDILGSNKATTKNSQDGMPNGHDFVIIITKKEQLSLFNVSIKY